MKGAPLARFFFALRTAPVRQKSARTSKLASWRAAEHYFRRRQRFIFLTRDMIEPRLICHIRSPALSVHHICASVISI
jgi:hypothetical protein